jgi:lipopolysaccharide/colanic/teichoic acid biosynthesis glycosyltransferase
MTSNWRSSTSILLPVSVEEGIVPGVAAVPLQIHASALSPLKRLVDIFGACLGLVLTALVFPLIALAIVLEDPGPVFYRQLRCGLGGQVFTLWKFRSMVADAEKLQHLVKNEAQGHIFKNAQDPRVTRVGRFLRKTSLDELPQFWNVLWGQMSLVGTRPPTVSEVKQYRRHHWDRLRVKPGITGEWQVHGRSSVFDFEQVVALDLNYQRKWSVLYDILLIVKTIGVVFTSRGAY